jgi:hypothetical protein
MINWDGDDAVIIYFKILSKHLVDGTEEDSLSSNLDLLPCKYKSYAMLNESKNKLLLNKTINFATYLCSVSSCG